MHRVNCLDTMNLRFDNQIGIRENIEIIIAHKAYVRMRDRTRPALQH